jgi:Na+/melibiose symporter-like transporter
VVAGFLLKNIVHFPADAHRVDAPAVTRLGLVAGVLAPLLFIIPAVLVTRYSITREKHAQTRLELDRRRSAVGLAPAPDGESLDLEMAVVPPGATAI